MAKELQMCYAGICYIVNYAETGSRHRPFSVGDLFAELSPEQANRPGDTVQLLPELLRRLAAMVQQGQPACECRQTMSEYIKSYDLSENWREWFT
jgi:5'-methylthioadenosine phosphorylase